MHLTNLRIVNHNFLFIHNLHHKSSLPDFKPKKYSFNLRVPGSGSLCIIKFWVTILVLNIIKVLVQVPVIFDEVTVPGTMANRHFKLNYFLKIVYFIYIFLKSNKCYSNSKTGLGLGIFNKKCVLDLCSYKSQNYNYNNLYKNQIILKLHNFVFDNYR